MPDRAVAVTGVGVVASCGVGLKRFWDGLLSPAPIGARRVLDFDPLEWFTVKHARHADRFTQLAVAAGAMAIEDAGRPSELADLGRLGVVIGTGVGGVETMERQTEVLREQGPRQVSPYVVPMIMPNAAAAALSIRFGWTGPCETLTTACASGAHAIARAAELIASGRCDAVLTGGSESAMSEIALAGFTNMTALATSGRSLPFDIGRDGFVPAEGAAVLLLEERSRALARGAFMRGLILGSGNNSDAHHVTAPSPNGAGAAECMRLALAAAGIQPDDVGHINAHGTATPQNDVAEALAIRDVFGDPGPPVTSTKGVTGHAFGAAGALEAVAVLLSIEHRLIPPTAGLRQQDPAVGLDIVAGAPRPWTPCAVLSNSFGFGGHNACLVIAPA